ncbi:MAG: DUF983 domain-containing protein [Bacteroidota bacterium]
MQWTKDVKAMFAHKCAECHQGDMFPTGAFSFEKPFEMHKRCPKCNANLEPEPGFYYGAMFVSYILIIFPILGITMFLHWILDWSIEASFGLVIAISAIIFVWWFRFARAVWLNLMVGYKPEKAAIAAKK